MNDLPLLGTSRKNKIPGTAVICGGSIAGLLTARALHDHLERVVIVEPEGWLSGEEGRVIESWTQRQPRKRLVQYHSQNGSTGFLYAGFKRLFTNFDEECRVSGINVAPADFRINLYGEYLKVPHSHCSAALPKTLYASRQALETLLRRLTLHKPAYPNITQVSGTVVGATVDLSQPGYIQGVTVRTNDGAFSEIEASLVVDCSGPTQAGIKILHRAGFTDKESLSQLKVTFDPKMAYSTLCFAVSPGLAARLPIPGGFESLGGAIIAVLCDLTKDTKTFACVKQEGNIVSMCCGAWGGSDLPTTLSGVREHVASITLTRPLPPWFWDFLDLMREVQDTCTCSTVRIPPSFWTHYEKAQNLPSNWIAIGDSVSRVNPVFGQGSSKALLGVLAANTLVCGLKENRVPSDFSLRFFKSQANKIKLVWNNAKLVDYGMPTTTPAAGEDRASCSLSRWFMRRLQELSRTDEQAGSVLWHAQMMLNSTSIDALHPILVIKVLWLALRRSFPVSRT
ncbi:hypothetical protein CPB85DRAFT_1441025 [Mucidula mucida]|nr:hypothetical protein CPB85DRAFT_1441025 [Mucidula mucida]